jgi:hypothetical protein
MGYRWVGDGVKMVGGFPFMPTFVDLFTNFSLKWSGNLTRKTLDLTKGF